MRVTSLYLAQCLLWIALMVGTCFAQEIDTPSYYAVTDNDSINRTIDLRGTLNVRFAGVEFLNPNKGYPIKSGYKTYYLYAVKCEEASINGGKIPNKGAKMYFVVCSARPSIIADPEELISKATFVKGIIDQSDSLPTYIKYYNQFKTIGDSLQLLIEDSKEYIGSEMKETYAKARLVQKSMLEVIQMYLALKRAVAQKDILLFFMTYHVHRSIQYSIASFPLGLPKYMMEEDVQVAEAKKNPNKKRRIELNPPPSPEKRRKFRDIELYPG